MKKLTNIQTRKMTLLGLVLIQSWFLSSCQTLGLSARVKTADNVNIPFIKNSPNECYYLDEFMPTPDGMVTGKSGKLALRYYTYKAANYKDWQDSHVVLSFYSPDDRCWSLFEEYYVKD